MDNCCAVCVTYNPDLKVLRKALCACSGQVDKIYVVDNGSSFLDKRFFEKLEKIEPVCLGNNKGIAAAFNVAIEKARVADYKYILLLDQDSVVPTGMVEKFIQVMDSLSASADLVSAIGPRYRNPQNLHTSRFVQNKWLRNSYRDGKRNNSIVPTDFLISSGSLYDLSVFDEVGLFNEDLFVDHVDTEWFLRANKLGYRCFGIWDVVMEHSLGETALRFWFLRWRTQPMHKPFRLYYIIRNSLLMYRMPHISKKWISGDVIRLLRLIFIYAIFSSKRCESFKWIRRGFQDGIRGVSGPAPSI